ncbi:hypothetical protein BU24DRAFT_419132 [Aaosphaeria arxii CBS 175.79]|uniref:Uncharacterized protein n=1 Tax=Aaosphaeria arxii CBS 175.79 TaxID=1450172 RepID=A0A6A5Y209_9PLEO|nr:uncharacterized protein BU24DRAFT_419132 [Aaosphaeria arxii CBS 175.79]KAF2019532.1 hypothetical protein BU24DRAFT_419132 [Aaosphaeria arxii CBS 175.79]
MTDVIIDTFVTHGHLLKFILLELLTFVVLMTMGARASPDNESGRNERKTNEMLMPVHKINHPVPGFPSIWSG